PRHIEKVRPGAWGYLNITEPAEGWAQYFGTPNIPAVGSYDFVTTGRRFEIGGTANYPGNVGLGASVAMINELGAVAIEEYIVNLTDRLIDRLRAAGAAVVSPPERTARSGIVTFTLGQGVARDGTCLARLLDQRILISQRYTAGVGGLRVSVHFFNNEDDIDQLTGAVARFAN